MGVDSNEISEKEINSYLPEELKSLQIKVFDDLVSTNTAAKSEAVKGICHGSVIIAKRQTSGRGRYGRAFYSPEGGIYMSVSLLCGKVSLPATLVTSAVAAAVCSAIISETGEEAKIKWVNDIYIKGKKVCGILCESVNDIYNKPYAFIVGIGINIGEKSFPAELSDIAASLDENKVNRSGLAAQILTNLLEAVMKSKEDIVAYCREHSCVIGHRVIYIKGEERIAATALSLDSEGGLVVMHEDGTQKTLLSGEVSLRFI